MFTDLYASQQGWDPLAEMERLLDLPSHAYPPTRNRSALDDAAIAVSADQDRVVVQVAAVGLDPASIEITGHGDTLTIRATQIEEPQTEGTWLRRERLRRPLNRALRLPFPIDTDKAEATYRNGVITIHTRRPEVSRPRRVQITTG